MNNLRLKPVHGATSPWLDKSYWNAIRDQFKLCDELDIEPWLEHEGFNCRPIELYRWIHRNKGVDLYFRALARFAPMFPVLAYRNQVSAWTSPPPSGAGNAIYLVMGHDSRGRLRLVGGNWFSEPRARGGSVLSGSEFFKKYDETDERGKFGVVSDAVISSIQPCQEDLLCFVERQSDHFQTMAIYTTVFTCSGTLFYATPAVIEGVRPSDLSFECFEEVK